MSLSTTYEERNQMRQKTLDEATISFIKYWVELGDDLPTAQSKTAQLSTEVALYLFPFTLGNTAPLLSAIQASELVFMTQEAKDKLTTDLTI